MAKKNQGKQFEENWKKSIPENVFYHRLVDPPQSFNQKQGNLRFSWKNPCDCFLYNGNKRLFYALELKTSGTKSFSFELEENTNKTANIHYHQIESLIEFSKYPFFVSGFIFNFRYEDKDIESTYFQSISDFEKMVKKLGKKSFNEKDLLKYNPIKIEQKKKRVNYTYNVEKFLEDTALLF